MEEKMQKVATTKGPRTWSSYTNITAKDERRNFKMSSIDNILEYRNLNTNYYSPPIFRKTAATTYDFPEHPPKKDKKWSLGSLFRRKKKEESESTSEEEADRDRKGFLNRRKKKSDKRKKTKQRTTFDHVILPGPVSNGHLNYDDNGILSDPTGGFATYTGRIITRTPNQSRKNGQRIQSPKEIPNNVNASRSSLGSTDSIYKKIKRGQVKVRAEARRETHICGSSSDEDSQRSASSSRLRSDESINKPIIDSVHRRSRAARTERYMRRLSKDEELVPGLRTSKSDAENNIKKLLVSEDKKEMKRTASRSPMLQNTPKLRVISHQSSGLSTIPPSHSNHKRNNLENMQIKLQKPPLYTQNSNRLSSINGVESKDSYYYQRSVSYDADIHRSASPEVTVDIIHAQLPIGKPSHRFRNLSLVEQPRNIYFKQPPPPPPRDPWRINSQHENTRPMSYCFERTQRVYAANDIPNTKNNPKPHSFNWRSNIRSTSEDHLPESSPISLQPRPSSATSDHPNQILLRRNQEGNVDQYQYLADMNPRSRKPILIQSCKDQPIDFWKKKEMLQQQKSEVKVQSDAQKALDFWKQKEEQVIQAEKKSSVPSSPQIFTASAHVRTNIFLPSVLKSDMENAEEYRSSPFKPISPQIYSIDDKKNPIDDIRLKNRSPQIVKVDEEVKNPSNDNKNNEAPKTQMKVAVNTSPPISERKSSNLEDALDELEAIYNSLRLGDEDLLERAEERERSIAAKKIMEMNSEAYPGWSGMNPPRGAISDSNFSYEPFDSVDSPKRKRLLKKCRNSDRKNDDMAVRKLNRERCNTISDPKEVISKVSYLLASPIHGLPDDDANNINSNKKSKEPDITYDDVVFRTIKHANNTLRVSEPQPPFGIPVGPILPGANSDYLHAMPDDKPRYSVRNKRIPDIVKDDLAFRNLRKDNNKEPVLPQFMSDDLLSINNNNIVIEPYKPSSVKKKRAVRSLSANIYNLISEPFIYSLSEEKQSEATDENKEKSDIDNIADAMEIARQILKEKEEKINATRRAFLSDTEAKYKRLEKGNTYLTECRMNFLNNMKSKENENERVKNESMHMDNHITSKPPRGMTPDKKLSSKEPSLSPSDTIKNISFEYVSPNENHKISAAEESAKESIPTTTNEKDTKDGSIIENGLSNGGYQRSSLEDLLTAFAVEAQETSRRIANELKELEKNINPIEKTQIPNEIKLVENKEIGEAMDGDINDTEVIAVSKIEPPITEETEGIKPHTVSLANIVQTRCDALPVDENPIITEIHSDSDHDYVNMGSDAEIEKAIPLIDESPIESPSCKSPFEENKAELIAGFQEIKKVSSDSELFRNKSTNLLQFSDGEDGDMGGDRGGEECVLKCDADALTHAENNKCAFLSHTFINVSDNGSITSYVSGCKIEFSESSETNETQFESKCPDSIVECDVSSQLSNRLLFSESPHSSGFHSNSVSDAEPNDDDINNECYKIQTLLNVNPLSNLKSPKLVLNSSLNLENKFSTNNSTSSDNLTESTSNQISKHVDKKDIVDKFDTGCSSTSKDVVKNTSGVNPNTSSFDRRHTLNEAPDSSDSWCIDPLVLAFACTYGIACSCQFVNMDIITILGLLFVFISFIAALFL